MRLFVRIVERGSFTLAASDEGVPRSTATNAIKALETRLGARLLQRTTRHVAPTLEGEAYHDRSRAILAEIDALEDEFTTRAPRGHLRIDVHGNFFRQLLLPHFPAFTTRYPDVTLHIGDGDRLVDLVREGVDCAVRAGEPDDSGMAMRRLGSVEEVTVASSGYLERYGTPATLADLGRQGHRMIGFISSRTGAALPLEFCEGGAPRHLTLPASLTVTSSDTSAALARAGYGLAQAPRYRFADDLASGTLVEVLPDNPPTPTPISVLYPSNRHVPQRLRAFINWLVTTFDQLAATL